ncbi:MAG: DUF192 domain-containing protein [Azoarcus sp.]|nr:DUF192 domain-containing protein [Azoarcus sp.]
MAVTMSAAGGAGAQMPQAGLRLGGQGVEVEVAANDEARQLGLMYRGKLPEDRGMVFVFPPGLRICMWMKNTLIPLSVAFIDREGRILDIENMMPQSEESHCAAKQARYALEMNQGWFAKHGVKAGDKIEGMDSLPLGR